MGEDKAIPFGDYTLKRKLGAGGMGSVFLAVRAADDSVVALKIVDPASSDLDDSAFRFAREAKVMMELDHPNIVRAYSIGTIEGKFYLSTEFVPGDDLMDYIRRDGRIGELEALRIMRQVVVGLEYGAANGIVHRDVKPGNILIAPDGTAKLTDLGLAVLAGREDLRLTAPGTILGSPPFMSPEQAMGERDLDIRTDIYSLGCTFYCALCGEPPFGSRESPVVIMQGHLYNEPVPPTQLTPNLNALTESLILTCLGKKREERYQSYADLTAAIDGAIAACEAEPPPRPAETPPSTRRSPRRASTRMKFEDDEATAKPAQATPPPPPGPRPRPPSDRGPPKPVPLRRGTSGPPVPVQAPARRAGSARLGPQAPARPERGTSTALKVCLSLLAVVTAALVGLVIFVVRNM
ncbi:MAG: serine/threonine-protein kinase [Planctomycetota bacterium]